MKLQKQIEPLQHALATISGDIIAKYNDQIKSHLEEIYSVINRLAYRELQKALEQVVRSFEPTRALLLQNAEILRNASIPHISLYREILESIPYERLQETLDYQIDIEIDDDEMDEEVNIVHPAFFDAATRINFYINITENHINNNPSVTEEEKAFWDQTIKKVLYFLATLFMTWAMSDAPISDWNITKSFEKVFQLIDQYQQDSNETTEVIPNNNDEKSQAE